MEYDKRFAVFSDVNQGDTDDPTALVMDNLLHESGRLQLNTYQAFIQNLMNPMSDLRSILLVHTTGTGKTITALATATEYLRHYQPDAEQSSVSSIVVLGFTKDVFAKELLAHPEFSIVNVDEATQLKELEQRMHDSPAQAEQYQKMRNQYLRRLSKRDVNGIYQFYGYRQFANRVVNMDDIQAMIRKREAEETSGDVIEFDPTIVKAWIDSGDVRVNTSFIASLARSLFICDEVHNLYKTDALNTYGLAIKIVFDYFFKTVPVNDMNHGAARALLLSATPLTSSPVEIIPIVSLLSGEQLLYKDIFKLLDGVEQVTSVGTSKIRQAIRGRISYVMDDNPSEYPSSTFAGSPIEGIDFLRFVRSQPIAHQRDCIQHFSQRYLRADPSELSNRSHDDERGITIIKDIALPATAEYPHGVVSSKNIADLADLPADTAVTKSADGRYTSNIFHQEQLAKYSCKYAQLVKTCIEMKGREHGKMFVYHPLVQGSGTDLIAGVLQANGFIMDGDHPTASSICMHCDELFADHGNASHEFAPLHFTVITGSLSKTVIAARLNAYNHDANAYGERIKVLIGSRAMRESHTLKACRHVLIAHEPSSISEMVQIIGRSVRKQSHALLPEEMRTVTIYVFTTNVDNISEAVNHIASNEELAYKMKVLYYKQINIIERIMYDVSIDYLINFRFKLKETPPLLGDPYSLDKEGYSEYEKTLSRAYLDVRNGTTPFGIHTNRFNVFYFEGEVRITMIIIKRLLLDYQPAISLKQLRDVVRKPPFRVEYNTQLISDEAISVAVNKLAFREAQLRMQATIAASTPNARIKVTDALFDQTSLLVGQDGQEYKIVCIGDTMCIDSILIRRLTSSIAQGDACMIDAYRNLQVPSFDQSIDLQSAATVWDSTIDIDDVITTIRRKINNCDHNSKTKEKERDTLNKLPIKIHCMIAEWAIKKAADRAINRVAVTESDRKVALYIIKYYQTKRLMFTIHQLQYTRVYDRYKKYDIDTGATWTSDGPRPSPASLPIGHVVGGSIRLYQPSDKTWLELSAIGGGIQSNHPYNFYIYEDRLAANSLAVVLKIKFTNDEKAKGITMAFLQRPQLLKVGKTLGLNLSESQHKAEIIDKIEHQAWATQLKLFPKRVVYRLIDL